LRRVLCSVQCVWPAWPKLKAGIADLRCAKSPDIGAFLPQSIGNFVAVGLNLRRSRGRVRHCRSQRSRFCHQGAFMRCRAKRRRQDPQGSTKDGLGSRARDRHRPRVELRQRRVRRSPRSRASACAMTVSEREFQLETGGSRVKGRARTFVRSPCGHAGEIKGCAGARHVARRNGQRMQTGSTKDDVFGPSRRSYLHLAN